MQRYDIHDDGTATQNKWAQSWFWSSNGLETP